MPIYEYQCAKCGVFEHTQRITDAPLARCPSCRRKVQRLISNTSFQLKGSGWYVTDYARAGKGKGDKAPAEAPAGAGTGTDAKPEAKTEPKPKAKAGAASKPAAAAS